MKPQGFHTCFDRPPLGVLHCPLPPSVLVQGSWDEATLYLCICSGVGGEANPPQTHPKSPHYICQSPISPLTATSLQSCTNRIQTRINTPLAPSIPVKVGLGVTVVPVGSHSPAWFMCMTVQVATTARRLINLHASYI